MEREWEVGRKEERKEETERKRITFHQLDQQP